jgi:BCD family chlorophyll transporter-like MFS transporter
MTAPRFPLLRALRLALFPVGYGLAGALVGGTLNRVMIAEQGLPASMVGLFFAVPLVESPLRVWLGYRSDAHPLFGLRREPYIIAGAAIAGIGVVAAAGVAVNGSGAGPGMLAVGLAAFVVYGLGRNLSHNVFQALLADVFAGDQRARAVTGYEVASVLGLIAGAGALGRYLGEYDPGRVAVAGLAVAVLGAVSALAAVPGQEPRGPGAREAAARAREVPFGRAFQDLLASDREVRRFFLLVFLTVLGTMAQDVLLEPFGGLVLGMDVGETARLTADWGAGVLGAMLLSGAVLIPAWGHGNVLRAGLGGSAAVFFGVVACGVAGRPGAFPSLVVLMGLATGLAGAGLLTAAVHFTTPTRAGLLLGAWGTANLLGKASGSVLGGAAVDGVQALGGSAPAAYSVVFGLEAVLLLAALGLSLRVDAAASRAGAEEPGRVADSGGPPP